MYGAFATLLDDFSKLPARIERPPTFMEIAGYPHYENVCSNILAFYLDPEEPHGLETLVLDTLASMGDMVAASDGIGGNVSVEREVITDAGNRLDILIESDTHAIIIENKIFAGAANPFADYAACLDRLTSDGRVGYKVLLTLYPTDEGSRWGFENITYAEFVPQIRSMLGHYVAKADARYLTMLLDFLSTLENLQEETRMDPEFVKLLSERTSDVEKFLADLAAFKDELRKKVRELANLVEAEDYRNVGQWFYRRGTRLYDILVHDTHVSEDLLVAIDTVVWPQGWVIDVWPRRGDPSKLRDLLQRLEIPFEERQSKKPFRIARFAYGENLDRIAPTVQKLVDKIAAGRVRAADPQDESAADS
jgi:hypothetical protein